MGQPIDDGGTLIDGTGATPVPDAAVVICGTGINGVAVRADGATARVLALGHISGDWGGSSGLAEEVLWYAARAEDGRGRPTALRDALLDWTGCASVHDVTMAVHTGELASSTWWDRAPEIVSLAHAGDEVARHLLDRMKLTTVKVEETERGGKRAFVDGVAGETVQAVDLGIAGRNRLPLGHEFSNRRRLLREQLVELFLVLGEHDPGARVRQDVGNVRTLGRGVHSGCRCTGAHHC